MGTFILPSYTTRIYSLLPLVKISHLSPTGDADADSARLTHWLARFGAKIMAEMSQILNPKVDFVAFKKCPITVMFSQLFKRSYVFPLTETALTVLQKSLLIRLFSCSQTHSSSHILHISPISSAI